MGDDDEMRFSDEKLETFYQEFKALAGRFDAVEARDLDRDARELARDELMRSNTEAIRELNESTATLVQAWGDAQSVVRVGSALGKFAKWGAGIVVVLAGGFAIFDKFKS